MQIPVKITFRDLEHSPALEANIREHADRLEKFYDGIIGCAVVVEARHKHHRQGNHYTVRIDLSVPGGKLVASHEPEQHHAYTDVYVAVRDAFAIMRRQLEDYGRRQGRRTKVHAVPAHGRISELNSTEGYGRIETTDGRSVYFHRNSVVESDFDRLGVGAEVRFDEEEGDNGPQASTVHLIGKHHIVG